MAYLQAKLHYVYVHINSSVNWVHSIFRDFYSVLVSVEIYSFLLLLLTRLKSERKCMHNFFTSMCFLNRFQLSYFLNFLYFGIIWTFFPYWKLWTIHSHATTTANSIKMKNIDGTKCLNPNCSKWMRMEIYVHNMNYEQEKSRHWNADDWLHQMLQQKRQHMQDTWKKNKMLKSWFVVDVCWFLFNLNVEKLLFGVQGFSRISSATNQ